VIKKLPSILIPLAESRDGIEIIKHKFKNIFGLQFHPSVFPEKTYGNEIFNNLLNILKNT
jgi:anthranilate/para-aminobenzoate synthase component II